MRIRAVPHVRLARGVGLHELSKASDGDLEPPADLFGLEQSGVVIALLDGLDPGTVFEVGYARAKGIPVVVVAESVNPELLTMIIGSGCEVTTDLSTGIYAVCWHLMGDV